MAVDYEKLGVFYLGREYDAVKAALREGLVLYDSRDLTTHAVCVGMTGSGKTGLCLALLEEAAIDGVPAICIDPKGDLTNLLLTFPNLAPGDFEPWIDASEAARQNMSPAQLAAQTAERWKTGLADTQQTPERITKLRAAVDLAIYTPGAQHGLPLSVLRSLDAPPAEIIADETAFAERINAVSSGLLTLAGIAADPMQSRETILVANILDYTWRSGASLDIAGLIAAIRKPAIEKVGALDLETFYPARERTALAMSINNLLASPSFSAWTKGEPLDAQRLLFTPEGKPRVAIISIAHLSDAERMFIVTLLLNEVIAWMRRQSGTSSLRAIVYMDEIFGYFPPIANPPSKQPMLTLLKQGRAFGVGCVLATQNPVDLDYKGLSNAGTWFIGRLQTERDRDRVIDGLASALPGGIDRDQLAPMMAALTQRVFLMRNVHEDAPVLMKSRWALSYLRGPLTGPEIAKLMAPRKAAIAASPATGQLAASIATVAATKPVLPASLPEYFTAATQGTGPISYQPRVMGIAKLHFVDSALGMDQWQTSTRLAPLSDDGKEVLWSEAQVFGELKPRLMRTGAVDASYAELPAAAMRDATAAAWSKSLGSALYESARALVLVCDALKVSSKPGESEGDFRARLALAVREKRDAQTTALRNKYAPKLTSLQDGIRRAQEKSERERSQLSHQKLNTVISIGATVLGALFGRKAISAGNMGRATTAARSASRIGRESQDVDRAEENQQTLAKRLADLQTELDREIESLGRVLDPASIAVRSVQLSPRKSDIAVGEIALVWTAWRRGADGFPVAAYESA
ncbi:MAG: ATP-binding protein [Steroidobacteraceae bacterium]